MVDLNMAGITTLDAEFRKDKGFTEEDFQNLKEWYSLQVYLPPIKDELLSQLFHSCMYKMEPTKLTIENYFTIRTNATELFSNRNPLTVNMRNGIPVVHYYFASKRTPENYRVCFTKFCISDPMQFVLSEASKSFLMHHDLELYLNGSAPGDMIVLDMVGTSLGHLARMNPMTIKNLLTYIQEAIPVRLLNIHFINVVPFIDKIMALLKPFIKKEFKDKIKFHTDGLESLFEFVPREILPKDYGGDDKTISDLSAEHLKLLQKHKSWFEEEEKLRVVESKRPALSKYDQGFGVQGSFKKLNFD